MTPRSDRWTRAATLAAALALCAAVAPQPAAALDTGPEVVLLELNADMEPELVLLLAYDVSGAQAEPVLANVEGPRTAPAVPAVRRSRPPERALYAMSTSRRAQPAYPLRC